ncbi:MAG: hypothetical protein EHM14_04345 [Methanothrix sp.]|nr:MAG: hypothetical protein EHM14_04345 [Methanothrix sp.]
MEEGQGKPGSSEIRDARESGWIEVTAPHNGPLVQLLQRELNKGESETIALAVELHADLAFWMKAMLEEWPRFTGSRCLV